MDETYFLYSEKDQKNIKGRKPRKRGGAAKKRAITKGHLDKAIGHKLSKENVLCTYAWHAFKTYADEKGMEIYQFKAADRKSTRLNSSHVAISYAVFCLKKKFRFKLYNNHRT